MAVSYKFSQNEIILSVVGLTIVDVEHDSRFAASVDTRDRHEGTRVTTSAASDVDLSTADVELG